MSTSQRSKFSGYFLLISGICMLLFSWWFRKNYREQNLVKTHIGIPVETGLYKAGEQDSRAGGATYYKIYFSGISEKPAIRIMSENFKWAELEAELSMKKQVEISFQPKVNADGLNEIYQLKEGSKILYTFDERFQSAGNGNFFSGFTLITAIILILLGSFVLYFRRKIN